MNQEHKPNTALLLSGGILMTLGVIVLIFSSWGSFSPLGRVLTVLLPLVGLYIIAAFSWSKEAYHTVAHYALLTASLMLPFVSGVVLYQSKIYHVFDARLVLYASLVGIIGAAMIEFLLRQREQGLLVNLYIIAATISTSVGFSFNAIETAWLCFIVGVIALLCGLAISVPDQDREEAMMYLGIGYLGFWVGLLSLPLAYAGVWDVWSNGYNYGGSDYGTYIISLGFAGSAVVLFLAAMGFGLRWLRDRENTNFYNLRQASEVTAAIALTLPASIIALGYSEASHSLVAILLGCVALTLSYSIKVRVFRIMGNLAIVLGVFRLIFFALSEMSAFWPILLLVTGFMFFLLALFGSYLRSHNLLSAIWRQPDSTFCGLGEPLPDSVRHTSYLRDAQPNTLDPNAPQNTNWAEPTKSNSEDWKWFLIILAILVALSFL